MLAVHKYEHTKHSSEDSIINSMILFYVFCICVAIPNKNTYTHAHTHSFTHSLTHIQHILGVVLMENMKRIHQNKAQQNRTDLIWRCACEMGRERNRLSPNQTKPNEKHIYMYIFLGIYVSAHIVGMSKNRSVEFNINLQHICYLYGVCYLFFGATGLSHLVFHRCFCLAQIDRSP